MSLEWSRSQSCVLGISIVLHRENGFLVCQWGLALHPFDYSAPDAVIFQIGRDRDSTLWRAHQAQGLSSEGTYVFHLANIKYSANLVRIIIEAMSPNQKNWETHGLVWTSDTWVIRAIEIIGRSGAMKKLACPLVNVHETVILRATNMPASTTMQVVHNWLPPQAQNTISANRHESQKS